MEKLQAKGQTLALRGRAIKRCELAVEAGSKAQKLRSLLVAQGRHGQRGKGT